MQCSFSHCVSTTCGVLSSQEITAQLSFHRALKFSAHNRSLIRVQQAESSHPDSTHQLGSPVLQHSLHAQFSIAFGCCSLHGVAAGEGVPEVLQLPVRHQHRHRHQDVRRVPGRLHLQPEPDPPLRARQRWTRVQRSVRDTGQLSTVFTRVKMRTQVQDAPQLSPQGLIETMVNSNPRKKNAGTKAASNIWVDGGFLCIP